MSEQKRYTSQEMREKVKTIELIKMIGLELTSKEKLELAAMLRQAADAQEELAKVKARLEAVVKECERNEVSCRDDETFVEKTERIRHNGPFLKILRVSQGEEVEGVEK